MPVFSYRAVSKSGDMVEGTMDAPDQSVVLERLHELGHTPLRAEEVDGSAQAGWLNREVFSRQRIGLKDLSLLTRELATLLRAGLTVDRSLEILLDLADSDRIENRLREILNDVRGGATLADSIARQGRSFPRYYVNMVGAGEAAGALEAVLERLADYIERTRTVTETVRSALIYPIILLIMAGGAIVLLLTVVLPEFKPIFEDAGAALPMSTRIVLALGDGLRNHWDVLVALLVAFLLALYWQRATPERRKRLDRMYLSLPLFGPLISKIETARFARTLGTLLKNGVALLTALRIVKGALTNAVLSGALDRVEQRLAEGQGLADPLAQSKVFPTLTVQLVRIGEETGRLDEMLIHVADIYEDQVQRSVERLLALLVPVLTIGLGIFIALIIISVLTAIISVNRLVI